MIYICKLHWNESHAEEVPSILVPLLRQTQTGETLGFVFIVPVNEKHVQKEAESYCYNNNIKVTRRADEVTPFYTVTSNHISIGRSLFNFG